MDHDSPNRNLRSIIWGVFLISLGVVFLLERFGTIDLPSVGRLWPLVLFVIGATHLLDRRPGSAVMLTLLGGWFLACEFDWYGLTYGNSWGLVMVAVGAGMVVRAISGESDRRWTRQEVRRDA